jgi:hypothetical protein
MTGNKLHTWMKATITCPKFSRHVKLLLSIFVERSSTKECTRQPRPPPKFGHKCKHLRESAQCYNFTVQVCNFIFFYKFILFKLCSTTEQMFVLLPIVNSILMPTRVARFSWCNKPKLGKCTKMASQIPDGYKIYQNNNM